MSRYYARDGQPIDNAMTWARQFEIADRVVSKTQIGASEVSTVFLGIDHRYGEGPPLIFETMVFGGDLDDECERYSTEAEARTGHDQMVARVRALSAEATS